MLDEYYALRGWDHEGIPMEETFLKMGLQSELAAFREQLQQG
jgi:aldehyde:ferredoxin oxidoreductase